VIRDRASVIRPWVATAMLFVVVMLAYGLGLVPRWTPDAGLVVWLAYLALLRDQRLAKDVLVASVGVGFLVRLVAGLAGAPIVVRAGVLGVVETLAVACLGAGRATVGRMPPGVATGRKVGTSES
jgi:hypothetical protein